MTVESDMHLDLVTRSFTEIRKMEALNAELTAQRQKVATVVGGLIGQQVNVVGFPTEVSFVRGIRPETGRLRVARARYGSIFEDRPRPALEGAGSSTEVASDKRAPLTLQNRQVLSATGSQIEISATDEPLTPETLDDTPLPIYSYFFQLGTESLLELTLVQSQLDN